MNGILHDKKRNEKKKDYEGGGGGGNFSEPRGNLREVHRNIFKFLLSLWEKNLNKMNHEFPQ